MSSLPVGMAAANRCLRIARQQLMMNLLVSIHWWQTKMTSVLMHRLSDELRANLDDQGDYRPGLTAAAEHGIRHPLLEAGLTKADVRALARAWSLPTWDKPASPCLSSRLAPGVEVTHERTGRVEAAEVYLRNLGLRELRVRLHEGELARIEVPASEVARLAEPEVRDGLVRYLKELGFRFVTLDLEGFRSGSLNTLVCLDKKRLFSTIES